MLKLGDRIRSADVTLVVTDRINGWVYLEPERPNGDAFIQRADDERWAEMFDHKPKHKHYADPRHPDLHPRTADGHDNGGPFWWTD